MSLEAIAILCAISFVVGFCCGEWREFKLWLDARRGRVNTYSQSSAARENTSTPTNGESK